MFSDDFYPTPRPVAREMFKELSKDAKYILEPSAGMGNLADVIKQPYTYQEAEAEYGRWEKEREDKSKSKSDSDREYYSIRAMAEERRIDIDCIEADPNFCHVLSGKSYPVVGYDFLTYNGVSYYDAIVMNPPFSNGDEHLLKAWDFLYKGEIVCLLNAETVRNPHTASRKRLAQIIKDNAGKVTELGKCFSTGERPTDVDVVRVYLKKNPPDDTFDLWATDTEENNPEIEGSPDNNFVAIRDNLENTVRWYEKANQHFIKAFEELRRASMYMCQNELGSSEDREDKLESIVSSAMGNCFGARSDFLKWHRKRVWGGLFNQMQFHKWLDSKQQDRMLRDVARNMHLPFTVENIKATLDNVFLSRNKLFAESVANVFDELCEHAIENGSGPECPEKLRGYHRANQWKTNDTYKVNERLVFPYGCRANHSGRIAMRWDGNARQIYSDLDRILCVLDAQPFDKCYTVGQAIDSEPLPGELISSKYFEIRCYKKGTVHLKWLRSDLLEAFNKTAAQGKKWLGGDTSFKKAAWRDRPDYYCEHHGHEYVDGVCKRCDRPEKDPLEEITCPYCRVVSEYTGEQACPLHPKHEQLPEPEPEPQPAKVLALPAPAAPEPTSVSDDKPADWDSWSAGKKAAWTRKQRGRAA